MIIPVGFGQVTLTFTGNGLEFPANIVFGINQGGGVAVEDAAADVKNLWETHLLPLQSDDIVLSSVLVKYGPADEGPSFEIPGSASGSISGDALPSNCAYLLKKGTALGGRKHRGRMYVPGANEGSVGSDGELVGGIVASLTTGAGNFALGMALADIPLVVLHSDATTPTPVLSLVPDNRIATQRRRMRR